MGPKDTGTSKVPTELSMVLKICFVCCIPENWTLVLARICFKYEKCHHGWYPKPMTYPVVVVFIPKLNRFMLTCLCMTAVLFCCSLTCYSRHYIIHSCIDTYAYSCLKPLSNERKLCSNNQIHVQIKKFACCLNMVFIWKSSRWT